MRDIWTGTKYGCGGCIVLPTLIFVMLIVLAGVFSAIAHHG